jgi:hypothetical protein
MTIEQLKEIAETVSGKTLAELDIIDATALSEEEARKGAEKLDGVLIYAPGGAIPSKYILAIKK